MPLYPSHGSPGGIKGRTRGLLLNLSERVKNRECHAYLCFSIIVFVLLPPILLSMLDLTTDSGMRWKGVILNLTFTRVLSSAVSSAAISFQTRARRALHLHPGREASQSLRVLPAVATYVAVRTACRPCLSERWLVGRPREAFHGSARASPLAGGTTRACAHMCLVWCLAGGLPVPVRTCVWRSGWGGVSS